MSSRARILGLVTLALVSWGGGGPQSGPDVVVILLDTTRADHLGPYRQEGGSLTPFIDRLAAESVVFEDAWCASTCTAPSIASVFTGLVPPRHGLQANILAQPRPKRDDETVVEFLSSVDLVALPRSVPTLTEHLHGAGYQTLGIGSNPNFCEALGFSRGFDHFSEHPHRDAQEMAAELRRLRAELDPDRPTFTYLHFMDPHAPYLQRAPWCPHAGEAECPPTCRYRSEVMFMDAQLEEIFEESGWLADEEAIVLLVTDHGEEFWDHGDIMHRFSVYGELSRAGMLLRAPGLEPGRSRAPAHHTDVLPTLLALLDLPPPEMMDGVVLGGTQDPGDAERPLLTCRLDAAGNRHLWGLTVGRWRLLEETPSGRVELYDRYTDPGERKDVSRAQPAVLAKLRAQLEELRAGLEPVPFEHVTVDLTDRLNDELKHLGYTGGE